MNLIEKMFGTHSERELKMIYPIVSKIEAMRPDMMELSDEQLKDRTRVFKERLAAGETLDDILPEAFATKNIKYGTLSGAADRRHRFAPGTHRGDEDR